MSIFVAAVRKELRGRVGFAIGVGPVTAGIGMSRCLSQVRPDCVILVGTAGRYSGGPPVGSIVGVERVLLGTGVAELGGGYAPLAPEPLRLDTHRFRDITEHSVTCLTVTAIGTSEAVVRAREQLAQVEHMECYAAAAACAAVGVPFCALLGITNDVGPNAHAQWLANRDQVEQDLFRAASALGL